MFAKRKGYAVEIVLHTAETFSFEHITKVPFLGALKAYNAISSPRDTVISLKAMASPLTYTNNLCPCIMNVH